MNVLTIVLGQLPRRESLVSILLVTFVDTWLAAELSSGEVEREEDKQIHCASPQAGGETILINSHQPTIICIRAELESLCNKIHCTVGISTVTVGVLQISQPGSCPPSKDFTIPE